MQQRFPCLALAFLALAAPAHAADYDKYLLDDTSFVVTLNVRQAVAAPLFAKHYQKQVDGLLKMAEVQGELKKAGLDPLKDIDRIVLVMGLSSHREEVQAGQNFVAASSGAFPLVIVQGRFDPAKFHALAEEGVKETRMKAHHAGAAKYYETLAGGPTPYPKFMAVVDKNMVVFAAHKDEMEDVLAKAAGKKKTQLKHAAMQKLLDQRDPKLTFEVLASHDMVVDTSVESVNMVTKVTRRTLEDHGIESIRGGLTAGDDFNASAVVTCKQAAKAKELNQLAEAGLKTAIDEAGKVEQLASVVKFLKSLKMAVNDRTIQLEGQGGGDILQALFLGLLLG